MIGTTRQPAFFLPHGGGPWPLMSGPMRDGHAELETFLSGLAATLESKPRAIVVVTAHWEARVTTVATAAHPAMLYDYGGFPPETYRFVYAAPGSPEVANRACDLLTAANVPHARDAERGFDHGTFVPMMVAYPNADVPIVQVSLRADASAREHLAAGAALAPLRDEGVAIAGSGMTFHNMRAFFSPDARATGAARAFDDWLGATIAEADDARREAALERWYDAPGARVAHPTAEHFVPLLVAAGAARGERAVRTFSADVLNFPQSGYRFG